MSWRSLSLVLAVALTGCPPENPEDSDTDTERDSETDTESDTDPDTTPVETFDCHTLPSTLPEWAGNIEPASLATTTEYTNDAGLSAVKAAALATVSCQDNCGDLSGAPLTVSGATVLTIGFSPNAEDITRIWVADGNDAIFMFLPIGEGYAVAPGDNVSFTVTQVGQYGGDGQITGVTGFTVNSSANPVYVMESNGVALNMASHGQYVHSLYGELTDAGAECGPSTCFTFETRSGSDVATATFRIRNDNLTTPLIQGDCVQIAAPLSSFNGTLQFDINNFRWHRWYGNVNE